MEKIEKILTDCIEGIKSGRATLPGCLERYHLYREELEPLLKVALSIREPGLLNLDNRIKQDVKARLLQQIHTVKQEKSRPFTDILSLGIPARFVWARAAAAVIVIVIVVSLLTGGTAYASQSSLPGDLLYPVKLSTEDARLMLAGDNRARVELNLQFSQKRLEETSKLVTRDEVKTELALNGYRDNLAAAGEQINTITDAAALSAVLGWAIENLSRQTAYCDNVIDNGAVYPEPVEKANSLTVSTQLEFLRILEKQDIVQAAQSNVNVMRNRLGRAYAKAGENQFRIMQQVLLQYRQYSTLGEEILRHARDMNNHTTEIEAMSSQAFAGYLDTLDNIYLHAPQEYRNTIEACRQLTLQIETQARNRYGYRIESGSDGQTQPFGNGEGYGTGQGGQGDTQYRGGTTGTDNGTSKTPPPASPVDGQNMGGGNETGNGTGEGDTGGGTGSNGDSEPSQGNAGGGSGSGGGSDSGGGGGTGGDDTSGGSGAGSGGDTGSDKGSGAGGG